MKGRFAAVVVALGAVLAMFAEASPGRNLSSQRESLELDVEELLADFDVSIAEEQLRKLRASESKGTDDQGPPVPPLPKEFEHAARELRRSRSRSRSSDDDDESPPPVPPRPEGYEDSGGRPQNSRRKSKSRERPAEARKGHAKQSKSRASRGGTRTRQPAPDSFIEWAQDTMQSFGLRQKHLVKGVEKLSGKNFQQHIGEILYTQFKREGRSQFVHLATKPEEGLWFFTALNWRTNQLLVRIIEDGQLEIKTNLRGAKAVFEIPHNCIVRSWNVERDFLVVKMDGCDEG